MGNNGEQRGIMGKLDQSLMGDFDVIIDEAGRIAIPRELRAIIGESEVVVTRGPDPCLWLFTSEKWEDRLGRIMEEADPDSAEGRDIRRRNLRAFRLYLDKQGRILINPRLREFAGLSRDCMVMGQGDYIEIWNKERWEENECSQDKYYERSERFSQAKKEKELRNVGNSAHSGAAGRDHSLSRSERQG
jgi:MraZ protein